MLLTLSQSEFGSKGRPLCFPNAKIIVCTNHSVQSTTLSDDPHEEFSLVNAVSKRFDYDLITISCVTVEFFHTAN